MYKCESLGMGGGRVQAGQGENKGWFFMWVKRNIFIFNVKCDIIFFGVYND